MNKLSILSILFFAIETLFSNQAIAVVPLVEVLGTAAITQCPTNVAPDTVFHSDKIVFKITSALSTAIVADRAALAALPQNVELDIKIRDNPTRIANIKQKVLTFLGAAPNAANRAKITITDFEYTAVVCP